MILIADSGSTKCDWVILDPDGSEVSKTLTMGFNPYFHSEAAISTAIKQNEKLSELRDQVKAIYYYGAGCSSESLNNILWRALHHRFPEAEIVVDHDLLGAAMATYTGEPCIAGIIGTGSNSCFFDGKKVREENPALGYILGDEGSGSYFGKKLIAAYLYNQLPPHVSEDFYKQFKLTMSDIVENVYARPHANVYLASFVRFISDWKEEVYFKEMLHDGMKHYLTNHIVCYPEHKSVPVHFIGSVGYYFQDAIYSAAKELGITIGQIIKRPLDHLVEYHRTYVFTETASS
jgi:N-acetylglucosamine kinase-like BadF-type ATPase